MQARAGQGRMQPLLPFGDVELRQVGRAADSGAEAVGRNAARFGVVRPCVGHVQVGIARIGAIHEHAVRAHAFGHAGSQLHARRQQRRLMARAQRVQLQDAGAQQTQRQQQQRHEHLDEAAATGRKHSATALAHALLPSAERVAGTGGPATR
ncbi:hypothetical protein D3C72_1446530 [compost metagenome]